MIHEERPQLDQPRRLTCCRTGCSISDAGTQAPRANVFTLEQCAASAWLRLDSWTLTGSSSLSALRPPSSCSRRHGCAAIALWTSGPSAINGSQNSGSARATIHSAERAPGVYTPPQPTSPTSGPVACPFCKSRDVKTTSKAVNVSTYWRCTGCGQIWNASRLQQRQRAPYRLA